MIRMQWLGLPRFDVTVKSIAACMYERVLRMCVCVCVIIAIVYSGISKQRTHWDKFNSLSFAERLSTSRGSQYYYIESIGRVLIIFGTLRSVL